LPESLNFQGFFVALSRELTTSPSFRASGGVSRK
jgi:hypothetical protein